MKILKIWAVWCSGCLVMWPLFKEIEKENPWLETSYYEYDDSPEIVEKYGLDWDVPYFIFLDKEGNILEKINWEFSKKEIMTRIEKYKDK